MKLIRPILRPLAAMLASLHLLLVMLPGAQAGMVGTADLLAADAAAHTTVVATLQRADVRAALVRHGVDPDVAVARVQALSDAEAAELARGFDSVPAGSGFVELVLIFFFAWAVANATDWGKGLFDEPEQAPQPQS